MRRFMLVAMLLMAFPLSGRGKPSGDPEPPICAHNWIREDGQTVCEYCGEQFVPYEWDNRKTGIAISEEAKGIIGAVIFGLILVASIIFIACYASKDDPSERTASLVATPRRAEAHDKGKMTVERARKDWSDYELRQRSGHLRDLIRGSIRRLENDGAPELKEANEFMKNKMEELLAIPVENESDLEYLAWRYNGGELRTDGEVAGMDYARSGRFDSECRQTNGSIIVLFALMGLFIPVIGFAKEGAAGAGFILGIILALFFGLIGAIVSHSANLAVAKQNKIPDDNPRVQHERKRRNEAILGTVASAVAMAHHTKKAAKGLANVDGWKEMK